MPRNRQTWHEKLALMRLIARVSFEADRRLSLALVTLGPGGILISAGYGITLKLLTDAIVQRRSTEAAVVVGVLALLLALWPLQWRTIATVTATLHERTMREFERRLVDHALTLPGIEQHERPEYLDRLTALRVRLRDLANPGAMLSVPTNALAMASSLALLAWVSPLLLLLPLFSIPLLLLGPAAWRRVRDAEAEVAPSRRLRRHLFDLLTQADPAKEIRVFGLRHELAERHRGEWRTSIRRLSRGMIAYASLLTIGWAIYSLGILGGLALLVWRASSGQATPGDALLFVAVAQGINQQVVDLVNSSSNLQRQLAAGQDWAWLASLARDAEEQQKRCKRHPLPDRIERSIALEKVSFCYPGTETDVVRELTLELPAGSTVAIVGENGAGKTTLVKLLCRLYEPTQGRIALDGCNITDFDLASWRSHLTADFQDFARLEFLARESIGVGSLELIDDRDFVRGALDRAGATDLEDRLPQGLETQLGRDWDGGVELSLGQWQKLALGRASMREHPLLLLLDEPTASLDAETEHALFQRFAAATRAAAARGGVTLLVSHRFSTVRMADLIVVMDGGRIVESGDHAKLIRNRGLYAELYEIQARGYA